MYALLVGGAWVTFRFGLISLALIRLSLDRSVRLLQTSNQRLHSIFAMVFITVTFSVAMLMPSLKNPDPIVTFIAAHVGVIILFGYNAFAIRLYKGWNLRNGRKE